MNRLESRVRDLEQSAKPSHTIIVWRDDFRGETCDEAQRRHFDGADPPDNSVIMIVGWHVPCDVAARCRVSRKQPCCVDRSPQVESVTGIDPPLTR